MLQGIEYVPLLYTKRAEIRALQNLDALTRSRILPILAVRPWPNTNEFGAIIPHLASAMAGHRHGFDLDWEKRVSINKQPCRDQFDNLFDPAGAFANYYNLISSDEDRIPVFRDENGSFTHVSEQLDRIDALHRGVIIRIRRGYTRSIAPLLKSGRLIADDTLFVVDAGWSLDVLQQQFWASSQISQITAWDETVEIVAMSSSFPNSFTHIEYDDSFLNDDRQLFNLLVQQHNSARLFYGDWASTRQSLDQGGGTHYDRIDTALVDEWTSYRQTGTEAGYKVIADRILQDARWASYPDCWGKNRIACTSLDVPNKIRGVEAAISVRINMHLTSQANRGNQSTIPDEPYID